MSSTETLRKQTALIGLAAALVSIAISAIPLLAGNVMWWRAIAHFVGFAGMAACLVSLLSQAQGKRIEESLPRLLLAATSGVGVTWLANRAGVMSAPMAAAIAMLMIFGVFARVTIGEIVTWTAGRYALSLTLLFCLVGSWLWELYNQPFVDVYGTGPRGHFQWEQLLADAAGSIIGASWAASRTNG
ncbi:hypothetical protein ABZR56_05125 [Pseudomonas aeruginosa]